jgi:hypothetical protein
VRHQVLNDKRHILTADSRGHVALWDVLTVYARGWRERGALSLFHACHWLQASHVRDCGVVSFEDELAQRNDQACVPSWFGVEIKTGVCCCIRYCIQAARSKGLFFGFKEWPASPCLTRAVTSARCGAGSDDQP